MGSHHVREHLWPENKRVEKVTAQMDTLAVADAKLYCQLWKKMVSGQQPEDLGLQTVATAEMSEEQ